VIIDSFQNKLKIAFAYKNQTFDFLITTILYENQVFDTRWVFIVVFLKHPPHTNEKPSHHVPRDPKVFKTTFLLTKTFASLSPTKNSVQQPLHNPKSSHLIHQVHMV
jgi:hypothetical protein